MPLSPSQLFSPIEVHNVLRTGGWSRLEAGYIARDHANRQSPLLVGNAALERAQATTSPPLGALNGSAITKEQASRSVPPYALQTIRDVSATDADARDIVAKAA